MADIAAAVLDKPKIMPDGTKRPQRVAITVPYVQLVEQMRESPLESGHLRR